MSLEILTQGHSKSLKLYPGRGPHRNIVIIFGAEKLES